MLRRAAQRYGELLARRPVATNLVSGTVLGLAGDVICQVGLEGKRVADVDVRRMVGFTTFSGLYACSFSLAIFGMYPKILPAAIMKSPLREGIASSVLDCCVHSPLLYLPVFYAWTGAVNGDPPAAWYKAYQQQFVAVMGTLLVVWIPVQTVNFSIVPRTHRVVFVGAANLVWNAVLDFLSNDDAAPEVPSPPLATIAAA